MEFYAHNDNIWIDQIALLHYQQCFLNAFQGKDIMITDQFAYG